MAEAFKHLINPQVVHDVGRHLRRASSAFDQARFERLALAGLDELAFKARAEHLCMALQATLPGEFEHAADLLQASLKAVPAPAHADDPDQAEGSTRTDHTGVAGWALWAYGEFVARQGIDQPDRALQALHAFTQRFTAEFAIRPFIVRHPDLVLATLARWVHDPSAHVRRLVSEGSRPRLPWGLRLQSLVADPSPTLPLLLALQDDPTEYVRRSVANHLNDIAKDHPHVVSNWLDTHLPDAPKARHRLLRHASRSLIKQGHGPTLQAWGLAAPQLRGIELQLSSQRVAVGGALQLRLSLQSSARHAQALEIDYRVHHLKANGTLSPKTFKGTRVQLQPGQVLDWQKSHSLKVITTRVYHPGPHLLDIQVNGTVVAQARFVLTA